MDEIFEEQYNRGFIDSKDVQSMIRQICSTHNKISWERDIEIKLGEKIGDHLLSLKIGEKFFTYFFKMSFPDLSKNV